MEVLINFLMYVLPGGCLGSFATWLVNRKQRRIDTGNAANAAYEKLLDTLNRQSDDISNLYKELGYIRRAVEKRNICRYLAACPVDVELRRAKNYYPGSPRAANGQREGAGNYNGEACDGSTITGIPPPAPRRDYEFTTVGRIPETKRAGIRPSGVPRQSDFYNGHLRQPPANYRKPKPGNLSPPH